jgi:phosphohistidine phosphatase
MKMSRLYLLRHAKAVPAKPGMSDFDRPLAQDGVEAAQKMGVVMEAREFFPQRAICSASIRTRETLDNVRRTLNLPFPIVYSDALFSANADGYLKMIRETETSSLLMVGHNPSIADLAVRLVSAGDAGSLERLSQGFPTAALAVIDFHGPFSEAEAGSGTLSAFIAPDN